MRVPRFLVLCALLWSLAAAAQAQHGHQHSFRDAQKWSAVFDDPARDAWQKPQQVIEALALAPQARVADVGAGTGYFAARLAKALPQGQVYAVDLEPDMVTFLAERARREGLANLSALAGGEEGPRLPDRVDVVLLVNTYHHVSQRERYFRVLREALAPGGRVAIIDFTADSPVGPPRRARIAPEKVTAEMSGAGYALEQSHAFLPNQYFLVFRPAQ